MNERATTPNHDNETIYDRPPRFERLPDGLQLESLDQIVVLGEQARREYAQDSTIAESLDVYIDTKVAEALRDRGLDAESDDPEVQRDYQAAKATYDGVARTQEVDWLASPVGDPNGAPVRNQVINMLLDRYSATAPEAGATTGADAAAVDATAPRAERFIFSDEQKATRDAFRASDEDLARAEARRFRVSMLAGKEKRGRLEAEIEPAAIAYINQAQLFDEVQEQKYRTMFPDISDEALAKKMANYHTAKQRLHDLRTEHEAENGYHKFGILSKAHNKISSWYGGLSRTEKLGVAGAGVVAAGLLGLALSPLGAAGVGIMAGAKGYRSYMQSRSKLYERPAEVEKIQSTNEQGSKSLGELQTEALDKMTAARTERIEKTDKVNKRARITTALGGLVLGGGLALQAVEHWDDIRHFFGGGNGNNGVSGGNGGNGGESAPGNGGHIDQPHDTQKEAEDLAKKNAIPSSDTPGVADAINEALGGEGTGAGDGHWAPGGIDGYLNGDLGTTELTQAGLENFEAWANNYTVQPGDTIWGLSEKYLQAQGITNPSVYQIDAVKDAALADFQARGIVGVNGWLSAGQSLHVK